MTPPPEFIPLIIPCTQAEMEAAPPWARFVNMVGSVEQGYAIYNPKLWPEIKAAMDNCDVDPPAEA